MLSRYQARPPADWRFTVSQYGRPRIAAGMGRLVDFNLSNTRGLVVCAVANGARVGVDAEYTGDPAPLGVAERYFSTGEIASVRTKPRAQQSRVFYDYWTLKESYVKACGLGLAIGLDRFSIVLDDDRPPRLELDKSFPDAASQWQFAQWRPTDKHVISLCVRPRRGLEVTIVNRWQRLTVDACERDVPVTPPGAYSRGRCMYNGPRKEIE